MISPTLYIFGLFLKLAITDENYQITPEKIVNLPPVYKKSSSPACSSSSAKTCQDVQVDNFKILNQNVIEFPGVGNLIAESKVYHSISNLSSVVSSQTFTSEEGSFGMLTVNNDRQSLFAFLNTEDDRYFTIEKSGRDHVLIELDREILKDETILVKDQKRRRSTSFLSQNGPFGGGIEGRPIGPIFVDDGPVFNDGSQFLNNDEFFIPTGSVIGKVIFYTSPEFRQITSNIEDFVESIVAITNNGFENSGVNIRITASKIVNSNIIESTETKDNTEKLLDKFYNLKHSRNELLDGADIAILLFPPYQECSTPTTRCSCGSVYKENSIITRNNIGVVRKDCATAWYTLGHNLGQMFGAGLNREVSNGGYRNKAFPSHGYAKLLPQSRCKGTRTILSYSQARKPRCENIPWGRLNGYSSPNVCYFGKTIYDCEHSNGETYTGDETNDNVRVLNENVRAINGGWSNWSEYSVCDGTCGQGKKTRTRACNNPYPSFGGILCSGPSVDTSTCKLPNMCPEWSQWSAYSACSATCGSGTRSRTRTCSPLGEPRCPGAAKQIQACKLEDCRHEKTGSFVLEGGVFGDWGPIETCDYPYLVNKMQLKIEPIQGGDKFLGPRNDDTALNAIKLWCSNGKIITSTQGGWGHWQESKRCRTAHHIKGAKLRSEKHQKGGDDTTANGLKFDCTDGSTHSPGDGFWGDWSLAESCPHGSAVYGIQTRVEAGCGKCDDTALNSVKFFCAKVKE